MLTTAQQFFDIWTLCVAALYFSRRAVGTTDWKGGDWKGGATRIIRDRYGSKVATYAEAYYERLRADTQSGISSL